MQNPDYDGKELSLKLHDDGKLGSFEGASGNYTSTLVVESPNSYEYPLSFIKVFSKDKEAVFDITLQCINSTFET